MIQISLPERNENGNKGTFGTLLNFAGSRAMSGACVLSTQAALRSGVGLVVACVPHSVAQVLAISAPECIIHALAETQSGQMIWNAEIEPRVLKASAISVGCGMGTGLAGADLVREILRERRSPIVIDADALNIIAQWPELLEKIGPGAILTPHPLEMARLFKCTAEQIEENRAEVAKAFAEQYGVVLLLKGHETIIAAPDGRISINKTGNSALAKGGSGDVLTGIIAGLVAQGISLYTAATVGAQIHGACADFLAQNNSKRAILPHDLIEVMPQVMFSLGV